MSYNHTSIRSVVDEINRSYFIPDIQRNYVWLQNSKDKKLEQLFDSLMRGYPIGAFLFWKLRKDDIENEFDSQENSKKLNFQLYKFIENYDVQKPHNEKINTSQIITNDLHVVLDGQQRLTSLYIGLRGTRRLKRTYARTKDPNAYETKQLYLNVMHRPTDENPDDSYEFEFKTDDEVKNDGQNKLWFRVGKVMGFETKQDLRDYCDFHGYKTTERDMVEDLWSIVNKDDVISFFEEKEKNLDKVLKIFIRVNSGGMQLSYSDLLMSILTASFKSDIRSQMEAEADWLKEQGFECFGRDHILKTCLMLSDCNHVFKMQNFSKSNITKMEKNWDSVREYLHLTVDLLKELGYAGFLSSGYIISTICLYLYKNRIQKPSHTDKNSIRKFVQTAQIRGYFSTSLDTKISQVNDFIKESNDFTSFVEKMNRLPLFGIDRKFLEWAIENVKYGTPAAYPILQLLYPTLKYESVKFHIDHIYPKSKFKKSNDKLPSDYLGRENELWNLQLLEGTLNEEKSNQDPEEWVKNNFNDIEGSKNRAEYHRINYIPKGFTLDWETIEYFASLRKQAMLKQLMSIFEIHMERNDQE